MDWVTWSLNKCKESKDIVSGLAEEKGLTFFGEVCKKVLTRNNHFG